MLLPLCKYYFKLEGLIFFSLQLHFSTGLQYAKENFRTRPLFFVEASLKVSYIIYVLSGENDKIITDSIPSVSHMIRSLWLF